MNYDLTRRASLGALAGLAAGAGAALPAGVAAAADFDPHYIADRSRLSDRDPAQGAVLLLEEGREGVFQWQAGDFTEAVIADPRQAIHVAGPGDPAGAQGVWKRITDGSVHLAWFGAKFDVERSSSIADATDDSDAWEAALAYLDFIGGGTLHLPHGASKVTREIVIPYDAIRIVGTGTRKVYPGRFTPGTRCPSTLVPVHNGRNAFRFIVARAGGGAFCAEGFNLATLEDGERPEAAFGWEAEAAFPYGYTFRRLAIHGFGSAFDSYKGAGAEYAVGAVLIDDCVINRNRWIVRSLDKTQFNGFRFTNNKAGQNGYLPGQGGIAISGHDITIENNILEATRDAVLVFGAYRDISVKGNYFEANVGSACVQLRDISGPYLVGPNNYGLMNYEDLDHNVLLKFCGLGMCIDPYWPYVVHKLPGPLTGGRAVSMLKNAVDSSEYGFCRMDRLDGANWSMRPAMLASSVAQIRQGQPVERETNPQTGLAMPVLPFSTSGKTYAEHRVAIAGEAGEWAVASWLFKRQPDGGPVADPYLSMRVNGEISAGSRDYVPYGFSRAWRDGEWCLMTAAIRLQARMSSLQLLLHPHGVEAEEGRATRYLAPSAYTVADINDIVPFIDNRQACSVTAPPVAGEWLAGDILDNAAPVAGVTRFVCTQGGAPGVWVTS